MITTTATPKDLPELRSRAALRMARRVLIKAGTSVVANENGSPSLTRLGAIIEQIAELHDAGVEVIFVSSGAVGMGKNLLQKQARLGMSFMDLQNTAPDATGGAGQLGLADTDAIAAKDRLSPTTTLTDLLEANEHLQMSAAKSFAAAGQFEMMSLYQSLFSPKNIAASQILLTQADFQNQNHLKSLRYAIDRLLSLNIIPIINENDAVSIIDDGTEAFFKDNDSLAALCARTFGAEVCLLLTDVPGVFTMPPTNPKAKLIPYLPTDQDVQIGEKSSQGRGGMAAKIEAARKAVEPGSTCTACVVAAGSDLNSIRSILARECVPGEPPKGTLFATPGSDLAFQAAEEQHHLMNEDDASASSNSAAQEMATLARAEARKLQALPYSVRQKTLQAIADSLVDQQEYLLAENQKDLDAAATGQIDAQLVRRLKLTPAKIATLAKGIASLCDKSDPLGVVKQARTICPGLECEQITVPIGVLLIIFESRPDSLPQIASLALASGNGLLLKGGKEAVHSNSALHQVIGDALEAASDGQISRDLIGLITSRSQVKDLLALEDVIDLVIPRGSNALVSYIKHNTKIPVLGHADGVCHVYVDATASAEAASKIAVDSKTDYPSACNAMETLLLHEDTVQNGVALQTLMALRAAGVQCLGGTKAMQVGLCDQAATETKCEYGDLICQVEVVSNMEEAVGWIHENGSGHTEVIVTQDNEQSERFLKITDAACVFSNCSSRFADGFRLGLGAEVGISTGRIHARGPVGVEGLLTTKWQLRSSDQQNPPCASDFAGEAPSRTFTHKEKSLTNGHKE